MPLRSARGTLNADPTLSKHRHRFSTGGSSNQLCPRSNLDGCDKCLVCVFLQCRQVIAPHELYRRLVLIPLTEPLNNLHYIGAMSKVRSHVEKVRRPCISMGEESKQESGKHASTDWFVFGRCQVLDPRFRDAR